MDNKSAEKFLQSFDDKKVLSNSSLEKQKITPKEEKEKVVKNTQKELEKHEARLI
jgi:hypothetical protein